MIALGIGQLILDKISLLDEFPVEGTKVVPSKTENSIGGPVSAALILLSKLGIETYMIASVGTDEAGEILKKKLNHFGVKLISIHTPKTKTHHVIVNSQNGSRTIIKDNSNSEFITEISHDFIHSADVILFDRHEPKAFEYVLEHKKSNTPIVTDPSDEISARTISMIQNSNVPILPIEALQKVRRHENLIQDIDAMREIANKAFVITAGGYGSILVEKDEMKFFPAYDFKVIDTNGAGDIFRGAFAYGLLSNWEIEKIIDYSNLVAGLQCTKLGNSTAIPGPGEIEEARESVEKKDTTLDQVLEIFK